MCSEGLEALRIEELSQQVVENIVKAHRVLIGIAKREIPENFLEEVLREVEHIAIHELAHGAIRVIYPEIDELEDTVLGTCIDEIVARLLDRYLRT